jgi:hypothetical protein
MPRRSAPLACWLPLSLVHGSMHGGWCWKKVVRLLRTAGHEVVAPTLTIMAMAKRIATFCRESLAVTAE